MKNGTLSGLVVCFIVAILVSGCDKSEEKKVEAPSVKKETMQQDARPVQETAAEVMPEVADPVEEAVEFAAEKAAIAAEERRLAEEKAMAEAAAAREKAAKLERDIEELGAAMTARGLAMTLGDVAFDVNKADLKPESIPAIEKLADFLKEYPDRRVLVEGFTDSTGDAARNQALSERRALAVRNAIVDRGVEDTLIDFKGYGEDFPVGNNETPEGRKMNRRVEIIISEGAGVIDERTN